MKYKPATFRKSKVARAQFLGKDLIFKQATEPTNIIWENRQYLKGDIIKRSLFVGLLVLVLLIASFAIIFLCKLWTIKANDIYPKVNCNEIVKQYQD